MYNWRKVKSTTRKDIYDVIAGSVRAWEGTILVTQFATATATATATAAASLAADANFLPVRSKRAVGEGQGRKVRKSWDRTEYFSKEGRKEGSDGKRNERSVPFWVERTVVGIVSKERLPPDGASTGKACRSFSKREKSTPENDEMIPLWNLFHAACFNAKGITWRTWSIYSLHDQRNTEVWMSVKYGVVVDLLFNVKFSIFIIEIISRYFYNKIFYTNILNIS